MASLKDMLWRPRSRWTVLIFACWAEATAGLSYVFSTYSGALKSELSYDQRHINRLSVAKDLGDTVGIAAGLLCRVLPSWSVLLTGGFLIFVGYGLLWLFTDHYISNMPFWLLHSLHVYPTFLQIELQLLEFSKGSRGYVVLSSIRFMQASLPQTSLVLF